MIDLEDGLYIVDLRRLHLGVLRVVSAGEDGVWAAERTLDNNPCKVKPHADLLAVNPVAKAVKPGDRVVFLGGAFDGPLGGLGTVQKVTKGRIEVSVHWDGWGVREMLVGDIRKVLGGG